MMLKVSDFEKMTLKSMLESCMMELIKINLSSVRLLKSPEVAVFSMEKYEPQGLVMVPATMSTTEHNVTEAEASRTFLATIEGKLFKLQTQLEKIGIWAFWFLDIKHERDKCNLELVDKKAFTKWPSQKTPNNNAIVPITFPVTVNFKPIDDRERLVLYRPAVAKREERQKQPTLVFAGGPAKNINRDAA